MDRRNESLQDVTFDASAGATELWKCPFGTCWFAWKGASSMIKMMKRMNVKSKVDLGSLHSLIVVKYVVCERAPGVLGCPLHCICHWDHLK